MFKLNQWTIEGPAFNREITAHLTAEFATREEVLSAFGELTDSLIQTQGATMSDRTEQAILIELGEPLEGKETMTDKSVLTSFAEQ